MLELSTQLQQLLLEKRVLCFFATSMPDGSPHVTQTWVDTDGTFLLINTVETHQKTRNVQRDPRVMVSVVDPASPGQRAFGIRGRVVAITHDGAAEHFQKLVQKHFGREDYPYGKPEQVRVLLKIAPEKMI